jgi:hypothetical protein
VRAATLGLRNVINDQKTRGRHTPIGITGD